MRSPLLLFFALLTTSCTTTNSNNEIIVDNEIEKVFSDYVKYWSEGNYDKITEEIYSVPMVVYLKDSIIVLSSKSDVKDYLVKTFEELENNNYGYSIRNKWDYFRKEENIAYVEMHYTRYLKDSSIMLPANRYSSYVLTKKLDKYKISALIPFTPVAK